MTKLMPGIGLCNRLGTLGDAIAGQNLDAGRRRQCLGIKPQLQGKGPVDLDQPR